METENKDIIEGVECEKHGHQNKITFDSGKGHVATFCMACFVEALESQLNIKNYEL